MMSIKVVNQHFEIDCIIVNILQENIIRRTFKWTHANALEKLLTKIKIDYIFTFSNVVGDVAIE